MKNSKLIIKNVNINKSRTGVITILKNGVKIILQNKKFIKVRKMQILGSKVQKIKHINCPTNLISGTIDEFLIIFSCSKSKWRFCFKNLSELNQKEVKIKINQNIKSDGYKNNHNQRLHKNIW